MAGFKQTTVEAPATNRGLGKSSTSTMTTMFPASPLYNGDLSDAERREAGQKFLKDGTLPEAGGYFGIPGFSRDFNDNGAPDIPAEVQTGGGGLPATPYVPNPSPPGPGDTNPYNQPEPPDNFPGPQNNSIPGGQGGGTTNPSETSKNIARETIGSYLLGDSQAEGI
jgi:hypothetical protein